MGSSRDGAHPHPVGSCTSGLPEQIEFCRMRAVSSVGPLLLLALCVVMTLELASVQPFVLGVRRRPQPPGKGLC